LGLGEAVAQCRGVLVFNIAQGLSLQLRILPLTAALHAFTHAALATFSREYLSLAVLILLFLHCFLHNLAPANISIVVMMGSFGK